MNICNIRNVVVALLFLSVTTVLSCKKYDDQPETNTLLGKWYVKQAIYIGYEDEMESYNFTDTEFDENFYLEFWPGGKATGQEGVDDKYELLYVLSGDKITLTYVDNSDEPIHYLIKSNTANELVVFQETTDGSMRETIEITLTKWCKLF